MKKSEIILFTLLLSILGVVGSIKAAGVNNSSRSADLMSSATRQSSQNLSLSKDNCQNSESGKWILWSPRIQNFKKGDQVKILLPHGEYTGETLTFKIVDHGKKIATLTIEHGNGYGVIVFTTDANGGEIAQIVADFGSMDFGSIGTGGVIDIGDITGSCADDSSSKHSMVDCSSSLTSSGKSIPYGPGPVSIITPPLRSSKPSLVYSSSINADKINRRHSSSSSVKRATSLKSLSKISGMSLVQSSRNSAKSSLSKQPSIRNSSVNAQSNSQKPSIRNSSVNAQSNSQKPSIRNSSVNAQSNSQKPSLEISKSSKQNSSTVKSENESSSRKSNIINVPVKESSNSISLKHFSSTSKVSTKVSHSSKKQLSSESLIRKNPIRQASQPMVDQNGNLHLNPQQIRTLEHKMPKAAKVAKAVKKADAQPAWRSLTANVSKQGLTLKHRNAAHPVSNVHRVTLPIQGILPATRMDPYTWVYSLVGLAIMIVSGRAFFSKKRK